MQSMIADAIGQLLAARCTTDAIRQMEREAHPESPAGTGAGLAAALWTELEASGFADAAVPEQQGGSGLSRYETVDIGLACGRYALPLPLIHTVLVRGILAHASQTVPAGAITIADRITVSADGSSVTARVPFGAVAEWVVVSHRGTSRLLPVASALRPGQPGSGTASDTGLDSLDVPLSWDRAWNETPVLDIQCDWRAVGACATSALLAGALERCLEMTLSYAGERSQFGKPIGKFQAIQQQLTVMAEEVYAAAMAVRIGFRDDADDSQYPQRNIAIAKANTSAAVSTAVGVAHAVHGAIGFTEEYDLQLYARRLQAWRLAYGAESFWNRKLGQALIEDSGTRLIDCIRLF